MAPSDQVTVGQGLNDPFNSPYKGLQISTTPSDRPTIDQRSRGIQHPSFQVIKSCSIRASMILSMAYIKVFKYPQLQVIDLWSIRVQKMFSIQDSKWLSHGWSEPQWLFQRPIQRCSNTYDSQWLTYDRSESKKVINIHGSKWLSCSQLKPLGN